MAHRKLPEESCLFCFTRFKPVRHWQRFCSTTCREKARSSERMAEYSCEYCGLVGDSVDHVPPTSVRPTLLELGIAARYPFVEVRSCRECNCGLGHLPLWTVKQRKEYIKKWLRRRYKKYLAIPDWTDSELGTLAQDLRDHTLHGLAVRDLTKARLKH